jgi:hypothetical protein
MLAQELNGFRVASILGVLQSSPAFVVFGIYIRTLGKKVF